jgi:Peptidase family M1 domain
MISRPHADRRLVFVLALLLVAGASLWAQAPEKPPSVIPLFRSLQSVGINPQQIYKIREAEIDREDIHLWLNDGTIGFLQAADGHITGAYFEGDGEVLVRPPDRRERASLGLFIGQGVLEEKFSTAYLRFNDHTASELQQYLRPPFDDTKSFFDHADPIARNLASIDAMRLTISFTSGPTTVASGEPPPLPDRLLHARVAGNRLGVFDIYFDTRNPEQVEVGQASPKGDQTYYDLWMSFVMQSLRKQALGGSRFRGPTGPAWTRDAINVSKYTVNGKVSPPTKLSADATLDVEARQGGSRIVMFELSRYLRVKSVTMDGTALEFLQNEAIEGSELARRGNDLVAVVFPKPLKLGDRFALHFTYAGEALSDAGGGLVYVGARGTWYPNRGIAMANYDLTFRFPQNWTLVATGKQVSLEREGDDFVGHWISEQPIPIAGFNLGQYMQASAQAGNIDVLDYATRGVERDIGMPQPDAAPGAAPKPAPTLSGSAAAHAAGLDPARELKPIADEAADTLTALSQMLGPYPFSTLSLTQRPGMESQGWPGLIFLSSYVYLSSAEREALKLSSSDNVLFGEVMMPHELAHQWWGDQVSWASYHEQWLMEALANYCALLLLERSKPQDVQLMLETYRSFLATKSKDGLPNVEAGPVTLGVRLSSSKFPKGYEIITYGRGTWLIHMLRTMLRDASRTPENPEGDDKLFLSALRNLVARHRGQELTNAEFEKAFEEVLPRSLWFEGHPSLDWFFDAWVNGTVFPRFALTGVKFTGAAGARHVSATIHQNSAPPDLVTSMPVYGVAGEKQIYLGRVFAEGDTTQFTLRVPAQVTKLVLDPHGDVLSAPAN